MTSRTLREILDKMRAEIDAAPSVAFWPCKPGEQCKRSIHVYALDEDDNDAPKPGARCICGEDTYAGLDT